MIPLKVIPHLVVISLSLTLVVTFSLGYYYKHITYIWPYISDSGSYPPESCIFGEALNLIATLLAFALYVKYLQVEEIFNRLSKSTENHVHNKRVFISGLVAVFGLTLVANFQETTEFPFHSAGAVLSFGFGTLYICLQTLQYSNLKPVIAQDRLQVFRKLLCVLAATTYIIFIPTLYISLNEFTGNDMTKWQESDGGFKLHLVSTITEWICATSIMIYITTFTEEFSNITLKPPVVVIRDFHE